jgi:cell division protein FtsB
MNHNEVLKDKNQVLRNKNTELAEKRQKLETKNNELTRRIHELEKLIDNLDDGKVLKLKKTDVSGMYVTLSRYQKMCKLAEQSAAKVCDLSRENETLKRMIKPTEV